MNILVSGGEKTLNIVNGVEKKLGSGGVNFIVKENIEDIQDIFYTGGEFDKAIISVESWTDDYKITDKEEYINKLSKFVESMNRYSMGDEKFVFLTNDEEYAKIVNDEIIPIMDRSIIVLKSKPYSVSFMKSIMVCDFNEFPKDIVYRLGEDDTENNNEESSNTLLKTNIKLEEYSELNQDLDDIDYYNNENTASEDIEELDSMSLSELMQSVDSEEIDEFMASVDDEEVDEFMTEYTSEEVGEEQSSNSLLKYINEDTDDSVDDSVDDDDEDEMDEFLIGSFDSLLEGNEDVIEDTNEELEPSNENKIASIKEETVTVEEEEENIEIPDKIEENPENLVNNTLNGFDDTLYKNEEENMEVEEEEPTEVKHIEKPKFIGKKSKNKVKDKKNKVFKLNFKKENKKIKVESPNIDIPYNNNYTDTNGIFDVFARRGNSIAVTGCGDTGNSTIAYNLANTLCNMGYTVLLVDLDTTNRTMSYISKDANECIDNDNASLMQSLRSSQGINAYINILRQGFHVLTMGAAGDIIDLNKMVEDKGMARFINLAKVNHNFVIYDIPFNYIESAAEEVIYTCDNLIITIEANNHGIMKALLNICNIEKEELTDTIFKKAQIIYNKYDNMNMLFGKKLNKMQDIGRIMDEKVIEFIGIDPGNYFSDIDVCGVINYISEIEQCWFNKTQYSDTANGNEIFTELLKHIILKA